jgi:hypothetical protein
MFSPELPVFRMVFPISKFWRFSMPPARKAAELSLIVLLAICSVPMLTSPPPVSEAVLPLKVLLLIINVPAPEL